MRIEYLKEFAILAELQSFSAAAKRVHITQSALSKHIKAIEQEIGIDLICRGGKFELTAEGASFHRDALRICEEYEEALCRVRNMSKSTRNVVSIGCFYEAAKPLLAPVRLWYRKNRPSVCLDFRSKGIDDLGRALVTNEVDAAITSYFDPAISAECDSFVIYRSPLLCAMSWRHSLSVRKAIPPSLLKGERINLPDPEKWPIISNYLKSRLGENHAWSREHYAVEPDMLFDLIEDNETVAIVAGYNKYSHARGITFLPLDDPACPSLDVSLVWLKNSEEVEEKRRLVLSLKEAFAVAAENAGLLQ